MKVTALGGTNASQNAYAATFVRRIVDKLIGLLKLAVLN